MFSRRELLRRAALLSLAPTVPCFLARTARAARADRDGRVLVVVELNGGNDGINTVVPFKDEGYAKNRPTLRLPTDQLRRINDTLGFHPSMGDAAKLLESGRLTVVQGVGYPNPSRSHARSMAIWQTARLDADDHTGHGWLGRALDGSSRPHTGAPGAMFLGTEAPPRAVVGRSAVASSLAQIEDFTLPLAGPARTAVAGPTPANDLTAYVRRSLLDGYLTADWLRDAGRPDRSTVRYPETDLAGRLKTVAALLRAGLGARVFYTTQSGYDTHSSQQFTHAFLLRTFADALKAFLDDLAASKLAERVVVLAFSEFGRRVAENNSGTDHGTAGPVFLAGAGVKAGVVGTTPSLTDLDQEGDLKVSLDFRRVYATLLEDWLSLPARVTLGADFERLPLLR